MQSNNPVTKTEGRVAAFSALLFAICLFGTVASLDVPRNAADTELLAWWQDAGNLANTLISSAFAVVAAVLFAVVINRVLRLPAAAAAPSWLGFARSMGAAFIATMLVTGATRGVIGHLVERMDDPLPSLDVLRYSTALNYLLLDLPVMTTLALTLAAISVVTLRTSAFPSWSAYVGLAAAVIILGAVAAGIGAYAIPAALLWALCLSVVLWRQS
jgi:hypothetical protein